ncbi:MAG: hypothetical protein ACFHVJ_01660 [Aestuariibacter sp.]
MKSYLKLAAAACCLLSSAMSYAGDDPVNCRTEVEYVNIYEGWASCTARYNNGQSSEYLSDYIHATMSPMVTLSEIIFTNSGSHHVSCNANVPFLKTEEVHKTVCDYTPDAKFNVHQNPTNPTGSNNVTVYSNSTDRDGNVTSQEWFIDGRPAGTGSIMHTSTARGRTVEIKLVVTDNDGYKDTKVQNVYLKAWRCGNPCIIY